MVAMAVFWLAIWLVSAAVIIGLSLCVGGLVHWLVPGVDLGLGAVVGALGILAAARLLVRLMAMVREQQFEDAGELPDPDLEDAQWIGTLEPRKRRKRRRPWGPKAEDSRGKKSD